MLAIYKKELRSYFNSMIGYVFIAFFLLIIGIFFTVYNFFYGYADFEYTLSSTTFIFALLIPLLTMRVIAEENRQKTDQLLLTAPISATSIVLGKLLALVTIFVLPMLITCFYPLILSKYGVVTFSTAYVGILAFTLLGAAYLSIGLFISSLTESQVVAAVISFGVFLFTILMDGISSMLPSNYKSAVFIFTALILVLCFILYRMMHNLTLSVILGLLIEAGLLLIYILKPTLLDGSVANIFGWLSVTTRFTNFDMGILDVSALVYYISVIGLFSFLTVQVIKKKRWS
ncbi:MAG: putative rane protein [Herbinix sp.]|jgi:ABC-2 type transport system permease protein|nr:putative rane protein [Herbinix sp.]